MVCRYITPLLLLLFGLHLSGVFGVNMPVSHMDRLIRMLTIDYNKMLIPAGPNGQALEVVHGLSVRRIVSLVCASRKENQILTLDAWLTMSWVDTQLQWSPEDYGNVTIIRLPSSILWQPDIILYNNADAFHGLHSGDINMVITYDGTVFYYPPVKIKSYCNVDEPVKRNDLVVCTLKFGSWTYDGLSMDVKKSTGTNIDLYDLDAKFNKAWKLEKASVHRNVKSYPGGPETYIDITYSLTLKSTSLLI